MRKNLTEKERILIFAYLKQNISIANISKLLNRNKSTIAREIKKYRYILENDKKIKLHSNNIVNINFDNHPCPLTHKPPYVCNGCPRYLNGKCNYPFVVYKEEKAHNEYTFKMKNRKLNTNKRLELKIKLIEEIQHYLNLGQPITHIYEILKRKYGENIVSLSTIYLWINNGILKYKKRKYKKKGSSSLIVRAVDKRANIIGKQYLVFLNYISNHKKANVVEIDLICGNKESKQYILSIFFPSIQFVLLYILKDKMPMSVVKVFDEIEQEIGYINFKKMFQVILTDRGTEFLNHELISKSVISPSSKRCNIFYCDVSSPYQKPNIENIHLLVRKPFKKGSNFDVITQDDCYVASSNLNGIIKPKYKKTPYEMFMERFGEKLLKKLKIEKIEAEDVVLLPFTK